jgi:LysM repeat protein
VGVVLLIKSRDHKPVAYGVENNGGNQEVKIPKDNTIKPTGKPVDSGKATIPSNPSGVPSGVQKSGSNEVKTAVEINLPVMPPEAAQMSQETLGLITAAVEDIKKGKIIAARDTLNTVLGMQLTAEYRKSVKAKLNELSGQWLFSKDVLSGDSMTQMYKVHPGEVLANIGKKFDVPYEILLEINDIKKPESLRAGQTIKVIQGPFHVKVYRSTFTMDLYLGNKMFVKSYGVGLGAKDNETPVGRWRVQEGGKLKEPVWTDPDTNKVMTASDPDYPLGSRWIAIEGLDEGNKDRTGFAIHGTKDVDSIGKRSSRGCIRLYNGNAIEVYNLLVPGLSEVRIVD